jgi:hypothetical protein
MFNRSQTSSAAVRRLGSPLVRIAVTSTLTLAVTLAAPVSAQDTDAAHAGHRPRPRANAVTHWNAIADAAFTPTHGTNPMAQSRTLAILHAVIHDALNAIEPRFESYTPGLVATPGASIDAAVAAAARDVLVTLLPDQAALVEAEYDRALLAVRDEAAKAAGVATGQAAARATLTRRQDDGFEQAAKPYVPRPGAGEYQFTPPFNFAAQPGWGQARRSSSIRASTRSRDRRRYPVRRTRATWRT